MNKDEFNNILIEDKKIIDKAFEKKFKDNNPLNEALTYATNSGKRIRPVVFLESYKMLAGKNKVGEDIIELALILEMIHAYSLVHDDLPAMDNDDYRRGKFTVHKKFGEDIAVLVGDSLLNLAFENSLKLAKKESSFIKATLYLSKAAGKDGMIKGQVNDLTLDRKLDLSYILDVYKNKTAKLFMAACSMAAILANVEDDKFNYMEDYAYYLGLSFQLQDDILDKDEKDGLNILSVVSINKAKDLLIKFNKKAKDNISKFKNNDFHMYLIDYLTERIKWKNILDKD